MYTHIHKIKGNNIKLLKTAHAPWALLTKKQQKIK